MPPCGSSTGSSQSLSSLTQRPVELIYHFAIQCMIVCLQNPPPQKKEAVPHHNITLRQWWTHLMQNLSLNFLFFNIYIYKVAYCGVKQRGVGGARAAEEAVLWHQVLVCIHRVLHVLPADQAAEQFSVCGARQVHAVITLKQKHN